MDAAESLKYKETSILNEVFQTCHQEEIIHKNLQEAIQELKGWGKMPKLWQSLSHERQALKNILKGKVKLGLGIHSMKHTYPYLN